jgi:integrase
MTRAQAEVELQRRLDALRAQTINPTTTATVNEVADAYLAHCENVRKLAFSTLGTYRSIIATQIRPHFGERRVVDLTAADVRRWIATASETKAPATIKKAVVFLGAILKFAVKNFGLERNVVLEIDQRHDLPKDRTDRNRLDYFEPEEIRQLVDVAASEQDGVIYLMAGMQGLRRSEILALRWRDIDFKQGQIRVERALVRGRMKSTKSEHTRYVPLAEPVRNALMSLRKRGTSTGPDDRVFVGDAGGDVDGGALRRRYLAALEEAGLRFIRFHDLRHTFGSLCARGGVDLVTLQAWMGHSELRTTRIYLHHKPQPTMPSA